MNQHAITEYDWPEVRFRYLADVRKGVLPFSRSEPHPNCDSLPYLTMEYLRGEGSEPNYMSVDPSLLVASADSILLLWDGSNAGEFLRAKRGIVSSTSALVVPRNVDPQFFYWACKSQEDRIRAETIGMGIPHVNGDFLANMAIRLPPSTKQRAIADYLDRETARLDSLVATKERLLDLLTEKRQALITCAVTRGVGPEAVIYEWDTSAEDEGYGAVGGGGGMKDEMQMSALLTKRLKYLVKLRRSPVTENRESLPYIGLENIEPQTGKLVGGTEISDTETPLEDEGNESSGIYFESGDVLFGKLRPYLMKAWVAEFPGRCTTEALVMTPHTIEPRFLRNVCLSSMFVDSVDASTFGSKMPRAEWSFIGNMPVSVPAWERQRAIADYLDRETARLDELVAKTRETIALLKERRAALIAVAVTGQIDVEGAA